MEAETPLRRATVRVMAVSWSAGLLAKRRSRAGRGTKAPPQGRSSWFLVPGSRFQAGLSYGCGEGRRPQRVVGRAPHAVGDDGDRQSQLWIGPAHGAAVPSMAEGKGARVVTEEVNAVAAQVKAEGPAPGDPQRPVSVPLHL